MEEVVEKMDENDDVEKLSEDEEYNEYLDLLKNVPFSVDFIAAFLLDSEEDGVDLHYILKEIEMVADEIGESPEVLFFRMLKLAREMDDKKDKYAESDGLAEED